jgi:HAD superfamily hydrolase (TIGR01549 family)
MTIKVIFWDFDGVLINSNSVRDFGFETVLSEYPKKQVEELIRYHKANGGLSRYVKFRYFFENIRKENISDLQIKKLSDSFSNIMKIKLNDKSLLINETLSFIKRYQEKFKMHITSGSDQEELKALCEVHKIDNLFDSIHGSPTAKKNILKELIFANNYNVEECVIVGDSINDYEAAIENKIYFYAYNNPELDKYTNCDKLLFDSLQ